ncbi:MAG: hypothetical protein FJZ00_13020 [Candidatus Sericytochromatia bacterium]|uniref:Uncharacterized protein n=1 Tax=Candidatus Tanganyikabacteria bacterium TaxID=2961651 RepID=A0A937X7B5_9BACT|nr:hypothetical protein [Candidatus Tanganyikabacteria bacterium]
MALSDYTPESYFGGGEGGPYGKYSNPTGKSTQHGAGMYGLPRAFSGWGAPAKYSFGPTMQYVDQMQPVADYYRGEMGKDYGTDLYSRSSDIYEAQNKDASRRRQQGLARAGYGGGGAVSPFAALQVQQEAAARAGALGSAARESVLQAQAMRSEAARGYGNTLSSIYQAMMAPAQMQAARSAKVPIGPTGPSLVGPAMQLGASFLSAAS